MAISRLPMAILVAGLFTFPLIVPCASADGMIHYYGNTSSVYDDWSLSAEETQYGMIRYTNGIERFMLAVRIDGVSLSQADGVVWMFALPADADDVDVELMPAVEEFHGKTMGDVVSRELGSDLLFGFGTQLYPLVMIPFIGIGSDGGPYRMDGGDQDYGVDVAEHIESRGLTVEVVSTRYADDLETYLHERGLDFDDASHSLITEYIGLEYSFVVSWISDVDQFRTEVTQQYDPSTESYYYELGLFSTFPTDRIFYPMRLTSVYGETVVPMLLQIVGHVEPDEHIGYDTLDKSVRYKIQESYYVPLELRGFLTGNDEISTISNLDFTEVVITSPSEDLTADLWMVPASSVGLDIQYWLRDNSLFAAVMIIIGLSSMIGMVAGMIVFAHYRPIFWKFAILGLANLATIVGLWVAITVVEPERTLVKSDIPAPSMPYRMDFLFLYTFMFVGSLASLTMILW